MPLARRQVASESVVVRSPQGFWHKYSQRLANQLRGFVPKNSCSSGICKQDCPVLAHADDGITSRFDHHTVSLFDVAPLGFFLLVLSNIFHDRKQKRGYVTRSWNERDIVTRPN